MDENTDSAKSRSATSGAADLAVRKMRIWRSSNSRSVRNVKKLKIIQNKAIRIAYKLDSLSHTEDINDIAIKILLIKEGFQDI